MEQKISRLMAEMMEYEAGCPARAQHLHISSTMVRDMLRHSQPLERYMPAGALAVLRKIEGEKEDGK